MMRYGTQRWLCSALLAVNITSVSLAATAVTVGGTAPGAVPLPQGDYGSITVSFTSSCEQVGIQGYLINKNQEKYEVGAKLPAPQSIENLQNNEKKIKINLTEEMASIIEKNRSFAIAADEKSKTCPKKTEPFIIRINSVSINGSEIINRTQKLKKLNSCYIESSDIKYFTDENNEPQNLNENLVKYLLDENNQPNTKCSTIKDSGSSNGGTLTDHQKIDNYAEEIAKKVSDKLNKEIKIINSETNNKLNDIPNFYWAFILHILISVPIITSVIIFVFYRKIEEIENSIHSKISKAEFETILAVEKTYNLDDNRNRAADIQRIWETCNRQAADIQQIKSNNEEILRAIAAILTHQRTGRQSLDHPLPRPTSYQPVASPPAARVSPPPSGVLVSNPDPVGNVDAILGLEADFYSKLHAALLNRDDAQTWITENAERYSIRPYDRKSDDEPSRSVVPSTSDLMDKADFWAIRRKDGPNTHILLVLSFHSILGRSKFLAGGGRSEEMWLGQLFKFEPMNVADLWTQKGAVMAEQPDGTLRCRQKGTLAIPMSY